MLKYQELFCLATAKFVQFTKGRIDSRISYSSHLYGLMNEKDIKEPGRYNVRLTLVLQDNILFLMFILVDDTDALITFDPPFRVSQKTKVGCRVVDSD